ncbi:MULTISPECIES: type II toxin-antitoxin system PemK/MazF family toxin [unclassified Streptomyces]|uniref:type II toxin-antitoxin system PemK/MazF family toxin n=1 Tax=unclassified Streptomyces TaxID=2593676 RepID=UPI002257017A|nr:type II toxin-antitoxin system PemK/MazF family toxin [Streptomyces sp. NBC_00063]MCX5442881.1 type II toxin-antitoxin system PemK/MazF family toxin [Streptomyces sp. NBC_00063]
MSRELKRGDVWTLPDARHVLVVSLTGLDEAYGAVLAIVLHPAGRYPDTAMSVVIDTPLPATAVAVNLQQLRAVRFAEATHRGTVEPATMARVDQALRAVLDL